MGAIAYKGVYTTGGMYRDLISIYLLVSNQPNWLFTNPQSYTLKFLSMQYSSYTFLVCNHLYFFHVCLLVAFLVCKKSIVEGKLNFFITFFF